MLLQLLLRNVENVDHFIRFFYHIFFAFRLLSNDDWFLTPVESKKKKKQYFRYVFSRPSPPQNIKLFWELQSFVRLKLKMQNQAPLWEKSIDWLNLARISFSFFTRDDDWREFLSLKLARTWKKIVWSWPSLVCARARKCNFAKYSC